MKTTVLCRYRPHGCTCNLNIRIKQDVSSCIWFSRSFVLSFHFLSLSHIWIANENKSFASNFFFKWKPAQIILSLLRTYKTKKEEKESSKKRLSILFYILCVHIRRQCFLTLLQLAQYVCEVKANLTYRYWCRFVDNHHIIVHMKNADFLRRHRNFMSTWEKSTYVVRYTRISRKSYKLAC